MIQVSILDENLLKMYHKPFKDISLTELIKDSPLLNPFKEQYSAYLVQVFETALYYWDLKDLDKAHEQIAIYNSNFETFQIGNLIEQAINFESLDKEKAIAYLDSIPEKQIAESNIGVLYYLVKAALYFSCFDIDRARDECNKGIELDTRCYELYYLRGTCYALRELHHKAIPDYKKALKGDYKKDEITANLSYSYLRINSVWKALRLHKKVVNKFPENDKLQYNTGICYKRFKRYSKAIKYFDKAIALKPDEPGYRLTRGRVLMRLKKHKEAEQDLICAFEGGKEIAGDLLLINTEVLEKIITSKTANRKIKVLLNSI